MPLRLCCLVLTAAGLSLIAGAQSSPDLATVSPEHVRAKQIVDDPRYEAAVESFSREHDRFVDELVELTQIPAPPFKEEARARVYLEKLRQLGLENVEMDAEGNAMGLRRGKGGPLLVVAAHLDTVFPEGTDVTVKRVGTTLRAPGVGDATRCLAAMLAMIRAMDEVGWQTTSDILFVGNVGEEGPGDLRGVRFLFEKGAYRDRIARFISLDGSNNHFITNSALGSRRHRITFRGPGGHSWAAFGQVNPAYAMADAIATLARVQAPREPRVSYNVGVVTGGTSVNSIPFECSMDVDLRSASPDELARIDQRLKEIIADAVRAENAARRTTFGEISAEIKVIGDRPSGINPPDSPILRQVAATMRLHDKEPVWSVGSTDCNIPISRGIPAFAMSVVSGDRSGRAHSLDEYTDLEKKVSVRDFALAISVVLSVANMP